MYLDGDSIIYRSWSELTKEGFLQLYLNLWFTVDSEDRNFKEKIEEAL